MQQRATQDAPTAQWSGSEGFERFNASNRFVTPDPRHFLSTWRVITVDGLELEEWCTCAVSGIVAGCDDAAALSVLLVTHGRLRYSVRNASADAEPNSAHLFLGDQPVRFAVPTDCRALRVTIPLHFFASDVRAALGTVGPALASSRVIAGLVSIGEQVLAPVRGGADSAAARALRPLAIAVVEEATPQTRATGLREQMIQYIEAHISDPELGPATVAEAFGISLRWAHQTFDSGGESLGRHIRDRRLDIVAAQLRRDRRFPRVGALAERTGFSSRDSLTRAFRARYGLTIADYAAAAVKGGTQSDPTMEQEEQTLPTGPMILLETQSPDSASA